MNKSTHSIQKPAYRLIAFIIVALLVNSCATRKPDGMHDHAPPDPKNLSNIGNAVPRAEPPSKYGNPATYVVLGKRYHTLSSSKGFRERGMASWYGSKFHGRRTSSGETYDLYKMTAAHKTLPLPTYVRVNNLRNGKSIIVKVNDRGPFHSGRIIDLSYVAASKLGILEYGTGLVEIEALDPSAPPTPPPPSRAVIQQPPQETDSLPADTVMYLQVGAFRNRENAETLRNRLIASAIHDVHVIKSTAGQSNLYRVHVGPIHNVDEVEHRVRSLLPLGIHDAYLIVN